MDSVAPWLTFGVTIFFIVCVSVYEHGKEIKKLREELRQLDKKIDKLELELKYKKRE